jgi:hypothetical protein
LPIKRMKMRVLIFFFLFVTAARFSSAQKVLRTVENKSFRAGEVLKFRVHYGFIEAGTLTLSVKEDVQKIGSRPCYHVTGIAESKGAFDWFFKVRDRYESLVDTSAIVPWLFIRRISEGDFILNQNVSFNHYKDSATNDEKTIPIPSYTQDLLSAIYYGRTLDLNNAMPGDSFFIPGYIDDYTVPVTLKFLEKKIIKTEMGSFRCLGFRPVLPEGKVFEENEDLTIWVSDDVNRVPIRIQANVLVGYIGIDLAHYENLVAPLAEVK